MKLLQCAIFGILCYMAVPIGWTILWVFVALTRVWGVIRAGWLVLRGSCAVRGAWSG